jgi:hypothetical protein
LSAFHDYNKIPEIINLKKKRSILAHGLLGSVAFGSVARQQVMAGARGQTKLVQLIARTKKRRG